MALSSHTQIILYLLIEEVQFKLNILVYVDNLIIFGNDSIWETVPKYFHFKVIMEEISYSIWETTPWWMPFDDDIVLVA